MDRIAIAAKKHLEQVILPFRKNLRDDAFGSYYGWLSQDLVLDKQAEKGCILNSRILWFFSECAMELKSDELHSHADHA